MIGEIQRVLVAAEMVATLPDAELDARVGALFDMAVDSQVIHLNAALTGGVELLRPRRHGSGVDGSRPTFGQALARAVAIVRTDAVARGLLDGAARTADGPEVFAVTALALHQALSELIDLYGHRGPGVLELQNPTFSDRPTLLVDVVRAAAHETTDAAPPQVGTRVPNDGAASADRCRERVRDASLRLWHELRVALREKGARMTAAGVLAQPSDVFYLTYDQIVHPPADAGGIVARRRTEHARQAEIEIPPTIHGDWLPVIRSKTKDG